MRAVIPGMVRPRARSSGVAILARTPDASRGSRWESFSTASTRTVSYWPEETAQNAALKAAAPVAGPASTLMAGRGERPRWSITFDEMWASPRVPIGDIDPRTTASTSPIEDLSNAISAASSAIDPTEPLALPKGV
jgi:hypothetical protein